MKKKINPNESSKKAKYNKGPDTAYKIASIIIWSCPYEKLYTDRHVKNQIRLYKYFYLVCNEEQQKILNVGNKVIKCLNCSYLLNS